MRNGIILVMMLFGVRAVSQTTFSIAPIIYSKLSVCSYPTMNARSMGGILSVPMQNQPHYPQNPYYNFYAKRVSPMTLIDVGIRLHASLNNGKHLILLDIALDDPSSITSKMSSLYNYGYTNVFADSTPPYDTHYTQTVYDHSSYTARRYSLQYGTRLINHSKWLKMWLLMDFTYSSRTGIRSEGFINSMGHYYYNNAEHIQTKIEDRSFGGHYILFGLGLKNNFYLSTKNKNTYLFTFEAHYRQGLKAIFFTDYTTLINDGGTFLAFSNTLQTRGSGLYLQISRSFQLYPWKKKSQIIE